MPNDSLDRLWIGLSPSLHSSRFIAFGLPAGQETKGAGRSSHPALLYSRSTTLESLLSVALSFVEQLDFIIQFHLEKVGSFSMIILLSQLSNWVHFR
jgi:hypothetical protein